MRVLPAAATPENAPCPDFCETKKGATGIWAVPSEETVQLKEKRKNMCPIALRIGGLAIHWYGVMAAVGLILGTCVLKYTRKHADMSDDDSVNVILIAMFSGLVGARIFYVVQFFDQFRDNLKNVIRVDQGGLVFYGGFILAIIALIIFSKIKKIDTILLFDAMTPAMAIGHACGRIGCFLQGCCFGSPTTFLGVRYPAASEAVYKYGNVAVHPVQLYEAAANLIAFYFFFRLVRNCKRGVAMSSYFIYYGVTRFLIELMRGDNPHLWGLFTPAQLIGLVLIPTGVFLLLYFKKNAAKNA